MRTPSKNPLREGFTTGTAAAAAAKAALLMLLTGVAPASVTVALPPFRLQSGALLPAENRQLSIPIAGCRLESARSGTACATAAVIKDGGDDPDATHGMCLEMTASLSPFSVDDLANFQPPQGAGNLPGPPEQEKPSNRPDPAFSVDDLADGLPTLPELNLGPGVRLQTGPGVGVVTLPGLPVRPGEAAVNPEPRRQIALAAREAAEQAGYHGPIHLFLRVPEGRLRAGRTLNARLGILGGISILGTRGIVRPYSHEAWQTAIAQGMDIAAALGLDSLALATGRRSEVALQKLYPAWPEQAFVLAADFARFSISGAARRGFREIVWGCFPGKLLKLAQGLENTHARSAPADLARIRRMVCRLLAQETAIPAQLSAIPTVQGIFDWLETLKRPELEKLLAAELTDLALANLRTWAAAGQTPEQGSKPDAAPAITLCLFRPDGSLLYKNGPD